MGAPCFLMARRDEATIRREGLTAGGCSEPDIFMGQDMDLKKDKMRGTEGSKE